MQGTLFTWNFNFNQMKKLIYLFLMLFASVAYSQADFPEGVQITGGQPTTTTDPYLTTTGTTGLQGKVTPEEIPLTIIPPTTHYTPVTSNLKGHFQGIDNAIGNIPLTTAGNTTRVWFTGDATTITAGTFYLTNPTSKGTVANVSQSVTNDDNQKKYFTQDLIGQPFATATLFPPGVYAGNLSASTTPNSAQQRFTVELYKCDNNGTPIASGVSGAPVGDLGVTVILILDSGLLTLADGSVTNVPVSASLASQLSVAVGERIRYHVSAEKVGTASSNITESVWYGSSFNSFLDVPTPITSSGVSNVSAVTGGTVTNALDNLNVGKADLAGATFTGAVNVPTPTISTHAVTKGYADGLVVGLLDDRGTYNASSNTFPTTGGSGSGGAILKGDIWYVGTAGTLGGKAVAIGDSFRALVDSPGQTAGNWSLLSSNLSYVPENSANKSDSFTASSSTTYSSTKALVDGLSTKQNTLTNPVTGVLTTGFIPKATGSNSIVNSPIYTDGTNIGVGTTTPISKVNIDGGTGDTTVFWPGTSLTRTSTTGNVLAAKIVLSGSSTAFGNLTFRVKTTASSGESDAFYTDALTINGATTGVQINNLSGTGTRTVVADASGNLSATATPPARPYLVYTALISQSGTSAPTATVLENTTGQTFTWSYLTVGQYKATYSSTLDNNKTAVTFINGAYTGNFSPSIFVNSGDVTVHAKNGATATDGILSKNFLEIRIYP